MLHATLLGLLAGCSTPSPPAVEPAAAPLDLDAWLASLPTVALPLEGDCAPSAVGAGFGSAADAARHLGEGARPVGRIDGEDGPVWVLSMVDVGNAHEPMLQRVDEDAVEADRVPLLWSGCGDWPEVHWSIDEQATVRIERPGLAVEIDAEGKWTDVDSARGLIRNEPEASEGYVLFSPLLSGDTFLIDREGRTVHSWHSEMSPAGLYLLDDGSLLRSARDPEALRFTSGGTTGFIERYDWDGNRTWRYKLSDDRRVLHHDIEPMPNGHILAIGWEVMDPEAARAAGRPESMIADEGIWPDFVVELEPLPGDDARIVWEWHVTDHLTTDGRADPRKIDITFAPEEEEALTEEEIAQLKAIGYVDEEAEEDEVWPDFLHLNAIDYHPDLDQIALSSPSFSEIWILDHGTTTEEARGPKGDLLYRWGNPRSYGRGSRDDQQLFGQHDVRWIPDGLPGAGHLTIFNNGRGRPDGRAFSEVIELVPPLADGAYPLPSDAAWGPAAPVWTHAEEQPRTFFAPFISGAQRLRGGHTFLCMGPQSRFQEVTPEGRVVWEYRNPFEGGIRNADGSDPQPLPPDKKRAVFRATKLPPDHPGLVGRDLDPSDP